jgi:integrase
VSLYTSNPVEAKDRAAKVSASLVNFFQGLRMSNDNPNDLDSDKIEKSLMKIYMDLSPVVFESDQKKLQQQQNDISYLERKVSSNIISENNPEKDDSVNIFSQRFDEFLHERKKKLTTSFYNFHSLVRRFIIELFGDKNLIEYKRKDAIHYREIVLQLPTYPANWEKNFGTNVISEVLEKNEKLKRKTVEKSTFNKKHLAVLSKFFKWAKNLGYADFNIFEDMRAELTPNEENKMRKEQRPPFSINELNTIFHSENFTNRHKDFVFYGPLILLFSGMRFGELAQLKLKDIVSHNGIPHFDLTGDDKHLKNRASYRFVPLHDELVKIGLIKHVEERLKQSNNPDEYLFDVAYSEETKTYDSRRILRLLESFKEDGTLRKKIVVHSFRHSYRNFLVASGVDSETIAMAMGHSFRRIVSAENYNDFMIKKIQSEKVLGLKYEGLDISHLYI